MQEFVLGIVLGIGLVLAYQECRLQWRMLKERQLSKTHDQAIALFREWTSGSGDSALPRESTVTTTTPESASTSDTEWWDVLDVYGKPSGIKVQAKEEDYW